MTKNLVKHIFVGIILSLVANLVSAQTYPIDDAGFEECLKSKHPSFLDGNNDLIIDSAATLTGSLTCTSRNIKSVDGLQYFTGITFLNLRNNEIINILELEGLTQIQEINLNYNELESSGLPSLENFNNLVFFSANYNELEVTPSFPPSMEEIYLGNNNLGHTFDISTFTNLRVLDLFENDFQELTGLETLTKLESADLHTNELKRALDLSALTSLKRLDLGENEYQNLPSFSLSQIEWMGTEKNSLTFEDFLPLTESSYFPDSFPFFDNQLPPETSKTFTVTEGQKWTWNLTFDLEVSSNTYYWYKDSILLDSSTSPSFSIQETVLDDAGIYHCEVTNSHPLLSDVRIVSNPQTLIISENNCFEINDITFEIESPSCNEFADITLTPSILGTLDGELSYTLSSTESEYNYASNTFIILEEGNYTITLKDNTCSITASESLMIEFDIINCAPPSFSPNGDGLDDEFYIATEGTTIIFNAKGRKIRELPTPAYWDGTDDAGNNQPFGHYIMITNDIKSSVSLMK